MKTITRAWWALFCIAAAVGIVYGLYFFAGGPNSTGNGFKRRFLSVKAIPTDTLPAAWSYGRICGATPHSFFVEPAGAKTRVLQLSWDLSLRRYYTFGIPVTQKIISRLHYQVDSPFVSAFAGNGPDVFETSLGEPGSVVGHHYPYHIFLRAVALPGGGYIVRGFDGVRGSLGEVFARWDPVRASSGGTSSEGPSTDGLMDFDTASGKLVFVPFYQNGIVVMDSMLRADSPIRTIDTVFHTRTFSDAFVDNGATRVSNSTPLFFVNLGVSVQDGLVYVNSLLMADNEKADAFDTYSDLDVYSLRRHAYLYSIKVPRLHDRKLLSFKVLHDRIAACYPDGIVTYRLTSL